MIKVSNFNLALKEKAIFGIFSVFSLTAILLSFFIFPSFVSESSYADPVPPAADPSISIVPAGGINLVMTPIAGSGGTFGTAIANVTVNTSNTTGYTFTMNTETTDTDLKNSKVDYTTHPDQKITNLTTTTTATDFPLNKWGYNVHKAGTYIKGAANTYVPVPNSSSSDADRQIEVTDAAGSNNYTFAYGVKANLNLPSGDYSTTLVFSATANPLPTMQNFDYAACQALTANQPITLYDERDNEQYIIAKLADDNCWMLDNMRLDLTNSTVLNSLTTDNTNADSASLTSLKSGNRAADNRYASSGFEIWDSSHTTNQYNQAKANADYKNTTTTSYGAGSGKIGVYYNYCAASAGNYCYDSGTGVDDTSTLQDAQYDICPKNWRMPTGGSSGEYQALFTAYNNNQTATDSGSLQYNLSTPLSGYFYSSSTTNRGSYGYFWSSTWYSANYMIRLYLGASNVNSSDTSTRRFGFSVRCMVNKPEIKNGMYMQDVTQEQISNTPTDVTYTLKDKRDETEYTVAKLQDDNLWMTQNLELGEYGTPMNLTNTLSNVSPSGYTLDFSSADDSTYKGNSNHYGNFYSWYQAAAGPSTTTEGEDAPYDICPKEWHLPSSFSAEDNEFYKMLDHYISGATWNSTHYYWTNVTTSQLTSQPLSFVYPQTSGTRLYLWSSTVQGSSTSFGLYARDSSEYKDLYTRQAFLAWSNKLSVRCLMPGA